MKNYFFAFLILSLFLACRNNRSNHEAADEADTVAIIYGWEATLNDTTGKLELNRKEPGGPDTLTPPTVIDYLNKKNPNVQLQFMKISGDTLYVIIPDANFLTQQMGSTGPVLFFAESVYNLTEIPGIRYVNYAFEEGDHAQPGVLNRDSFIDQ